MVRSLTLWLERENQSLRRQSQQLELTLSFGRSRDAATVLPNDLTVRSLVKRTTLRLLSFSESRPRLEVRQPCRFERHARVALLTRLQRRPESGGALPHSKTQAKFCTSSNRGYLHYVSAGLRAR